MCDTCLGGRAPDPEDSELNGHGIGSSAPRTATDVLYARATRQSTKKEQLIKQREDFTARVKFLTEAIEILEKHPEIEAMDRYRQLERTFSF